MLTLSLVDNGGVDKDQHIHCDVRVTCRTPPPCTAAFLLLTPLPAARNKAVKLEECQSQTAYDEAAELNELNATKQGPHSENN